MIRRRFGSDQPDQYCRGQRPARLSDVSNSSQLDSTLSQKAESKLSVRAEGLGMRVRGSGFRGKEVSIWGRDPLPAAVHWKFALRSVNFHGGKIWWVGEGVGWTLWCQFYLFCHFSRRRLKGGEVRKVRFAQPQPIKCDAFRDILTMRYCRKATWLLSHVAEEYRKPSKIVAKHRSCRVPSCFFAASKQFPFMLKVIPGSIYFEFFHQDNIFLK